MRYSNKREDFLYNKNYLLYSSSENCKKTASMFCNIAHKIGMSVKIAIKEFLLFVQAKSHKNCLIVTMLFGSPNKANRYIQGLNKKTFNILEECIQENYCSCSFNESQNHCDCGCGDWGYDYEIISIDSKTGKEL